MAAAAVAVLRQAKMCQNGGGENGKLMSLRCCHNTRWSSGKDRKDRSDRGFQPQVLPIVVQLLLITEERTHTKCYANSGVGRGGMGALLPASLGLN